MQHDVLTDAIYVFGDHRIVDELRLAIDFRRQPRDPCLTSFSVEPLILAMMPLLMFRFPIMSGSSFVESGLLLFLI